jgi:translocation and assembly module TamB
LKRILKYFILAVIPVALLACLGAAVWLFGTTAGAVRLIELVSRHTDVNISATAVEGALVGELRLTGLDVRMPQSQITIEHLEWRLQPRYLFMGVLHVQQLSVRDVQVVDSAPETPTVLDWPKVPLMMESLNVEIERLAIDGLTYRRLDRDPVRFKQVKASVGWKMGHLLIGGLQIASDQGVLQGNLAARFSRPLLTLDLVASPARPTAGMETFHIRGKFGPGQKLETLAGSLDLSGYGKPGDKKPLWEMAVNAGMVSYGFSLKRVRLSRPDRRGVITADGRLVLSGPEPIFALRANMDDFDLSSEFKLPLDLSASLLFEGTANRYGGRITAANKAEGWSSIRLTGNYAGTLDGVAFSAVEGSILKGDLRGHLAVNWQDGLAIEGALSGRNLEPAVLNPGWQGVINADFSGQARAQTGKPLSGNVTVTLHESRLHGQRLEGELRASFTDDDIQIRQLALKGKGFDITAAGAVRDKLDFTARITDVSRLVPDTAGSLTASGWGRWRSGRVSGVVSAQGGNLKVGALTIASAEITGTIEDKDAMPVHLAANFKKLRYQDLAADALTLRGNGTLRDHTINAALHVGRYETRLALSGSYQDESWHGQVTRFDGTDGVGPWKLVQPAALSITQRGFSIEPVMITGVNSEQVRLSASLSGEPLTGTVSLDWDALNLARADVWIPEASVTGLTSGSMRLHLLPGKNLSLKGKASVRGTAEVQGRRITVRQGEMTFDTHEKGILAALDIQLAQGETLKGAFSSSSPARLALPEEGHFDLSLDGIDLAPLAAWLPDQATLEGRLTGKISGRLLPGRRLDLSGRAALSASKIRWQGERGDIHIDLRDGTLDAVWRDEALSGNLTLTLADYGKLQSRFRLPVAARFPVVMDGGGRFEATLTGQAREKGMLGVLFPGFIQESRGDVEVDLRAGGTWDAPLLSGQVQLSKAGAYLPSAGITVKDVRIAARLSRDAVHIDSFRAVSGSGHIEGTALIRMKGWQVVGYEGRLEGERFQTVYVPELQIQSSPKLTFTGTLEKVAVRGEVLLPAVEVIGTPSQGAIEPSPDVVIEGRTKAQSKRLPLRLDVQIGVILGDNVQMRAAGIDAKLGGRIDLQFEDLDHIFGRGEIRVVKGRFRTYGVNLDIVRGRLFYAGGPINQPFLDILALRRVGEVRAGVAVSGTLREPLVKLYSEPFMEDMDILAYIVLGRRLSADNQEANLLMMAAGALLTSRQSEDLQRKIKDRLGFAEFQISTDVVEQDGYMGYKPVRVAPGMGAATTSAGVSETMLVVGRYLTPKLYISYGRSLFSGGNLFSLRYDISKHWQLESQTGRESGVDIYYKLEFK